MNRIYSIYWALGISLLLLSFSNTEVYAEGEKLKQLANKELAHRPGHRNRDRHHRGRDRHHRHRDRHRHERGRGRGHGHRHRHKPGGWYYSPPRHGHHRHHHPHNYRSHLPFGFARLLIHGLEYFYHSGRFYRPYSDGFVVVGAPLGAVIASLPYGYSVVNSNGHQYYVVNDTYYITHPQGYQVVSRPANTINTFPVTPSPVQQPGNQLYIYPQRGQTTEQQARDEYECHRWSVEQTGFDPVQSTSNTALQQNYRRAMSACLEARGYTVK